MSRTVSPLSFKKINSADKSPKKRTAKKEWDEALSLRKSKSTNFAVKLEKESSAKQIKQEEKNLVLDLDETLISLGVRRYQMPCKKINLMIKGDEVTYYVAMRPGLIEFLEIMKEYYNIYLYTTSSSYYANTVLRELNIAGYFKKVYGKDYCWSSADSLLIKDLQRVGFSLTSTILIDDSQAQSTKQPDNTICIKKFKGEEHDNELSNLIPFLKELSDVRKVSAYFQEYFGRKSREIESVFASGFDAIKTDLTAEDQDAQDADFAEDDVREATPSNLKEFERDVTGLKVKKNTPATLNIKISSPKNTEQDMKMSDRSHVFQVPERSPQLRL